ncbi:GNAT family N-acetyltransferase [Paenibacillus flagellatus]|uniref:GNAT family N-acetyltransferase n=1 Tax=Paenibacillus flagellatus TaxID=2211139 RepID=UPI001FE66E61|nr:GNAT family N-acetyltransferase [Paenibacillus flagellatus]
MEHLVIRPLADGEPAPLDLLLLADPSRKAVDDYLRRGTCMVAELAGDVVGVYVLIATRPLTAELVNVAVAEPLHGKGIGKRLVLHAIETAKTLGYADIEVGTGNSGMLQLALYQKCGFRITGVDPDFFVRHYPEEIVENGIRCRDMVRLSLSLSRVQ